MKSSLCLSVDAESALFGLTSSAALDFVLSRPVSLVAVCVVSGHNFQNVRFLSPNVAQFIHFFWVDSFFLPQIILLAQNYNLEYSSG